MDNKIGEIKIGAIIQARMGSSRLPGKILMKLPVNGQFSILQHIINSLKKSSFINEIVLATTNLEQDNQLQTLANEEKIQFFRGAVDNVLERFYLANKKYKFDYIVRVTADNPFIDIVLLDNLLEKHHLNKVDYTNCVGLPLGMNFEIISSSALNHAFESGLCSDYDKEHVTTFIINSIDYKKQTIDFSDKVKIGNLRLTVDYPSDFALANLVFMYIGEQNISLKNIIEVFTRHEWIKDINKGVYQKKNFTNLNDELKEAIAQLEILELNNAKSILNAKLIE